mgnify:CR=1 FL=1
MSETHTTTKYKVTTDGVTPCLTGHGITEVDPIDGNTAIVTVAGNGVMFEQHAATCKAILEIEEIPAVSDIENRYRIYHRSEAGRPDLHKDGEWFFEPKGYGEGEVYSRGFATRKQAVAAAERWEDDNDFADAVDEADEAAFDREAL